jgi:hypothetical protein
VRARIALAFLIFVVIAFISAAQGAPDEPRRVVQASEILGKIERGEPVNYSHVIIEGDLNISDLDLPRVPVARSKNEIEFLGLSESLKLVRSTLVIEESLDKRRCGPLQRDHAGTIFL